MAFNKEIQGELSKRMPPGVEVKTTHALGLAALKGAYRGSNLDAQKVQAILKQPEWFEPDARGYLTPAQSQKVTALRKLASFTKSTLGLTVEEMLVSLQKLKLSPFLLEPEMEERIREMPDHLQESVTKRAIANLHKALMALLDQCLKHIGYGYDFDDMVWAPIALGLKFEQFDWVLVDEAQDLTKVQIEMVSRCIKQTGRVCVVGDVLQAIYTFRGADAEAFRLLVSRLNAKVMPLSITYRCGKAIVEFVRSRVPGLALEAGPGNAPGEVRFEEQLDLSQLRHGDFVISRSNAPLLGNAIRALAFGHKAVILGKDLSADLTNEILRIQKGIRYSKEDKATVLDGLERDIKRQCEERAQRGEECEDLTDRIECFRALFLACPTLAAVFKMVASLCVDKETGLAGCLVFTNTHKVKGLEADRVFMLAPTFRPERGQEEMNLWYVAATRAKQTLTMVNSR
jgi:DNA helicase-2/ATP-dependent DNA helicase PcrA